jgi:NDP-sugar pyrophosphorylase family protein
VPGRWFDIGSTQTYEEANRTFQPEAFQSDAFAG